ncbi:anti-sigma factor family protein [Spiribacter halobius]|uniref:Anti-sigma factor n=1 Tax=Sediminicurvatus halobius TaxID=2182432 RepID=A0A2U2N286_9GAMM|nr:anti-sigma factor [Spiribacter halobius]
MHERRRICEQVVKGLFAYLDGELDEAACVEIGRHVKTCPSCYRRLAFEKRLRAKIRQCSSQDAPERLYRRVKNVLDNNLTTTQNA